MTQLPPCPHCASEVGPPELRLMADHCRFLWSSSPELDVHHDDEGDLDPVRIGVSAELTARLRRWHADWEEMAYPPSPFSPQAAREWGLRGWELALALAQLEPLVVRHHHGLGGPGRDPDRAVPIRERRQR